LPTKSRAPLLAGIGCAAGVLVGGAIAVSVLFSDSLFPQDEPATAESPLAPPSAPLEPPSEPQVAVPARPAARDPFADPLPDELRSLAARVQAGRDLTPHQLGTLSRYDAAHPSDVRARLLLAHAYMNARSLSYAMPLYQDLLADVSLRGDPRVLPDLLELAVANDPGLNEPAAALIVDVYGSEAMPGIDAAIARVTRRDRIGRDRRERLEAIRQRILGPGQP
jgi:hypothetical protein